MQMWNLNHWITQGSPQSTWFILTGKFASPAIPSHHLKKWEWGYIRFWVCHNKTLQIEKLKQHKSGGWKSKIGVQKIWFLVKILFLAFRWPPSHCPHVAEKAGSCVFPSSYKGTNPILRALLSPQLNSTISQRLHLQTPSHWELGFNIWLCGERHNSVHNSGLARKFISFIEKSMTPSSFGVPKL